MRPCGANRRNPYTIATERTAWDDWNGDKPGRRYFQLPAQPRISRGRVLPARRDRPGPCGGRNLRHRPAGQRRWRRPGAVPHPRHRHAGLAQRLRASGACTLPAMCPGIVRGGAAGPGVHTDLHPDRPFLRPDHRAPGVRPVRRRDQLPDRRLYVRGDRPVRLRQCRQPHREPRRAVLCRLGSCRRGLPCRHHPRAAATARRRSCGGRYRDGPHGLPRRRDNGVARSLRRGSATPMAAASIRTA
jgi:hypothetical protein